MSRTAQAKPHDVYRLAQLTNLTRTEVPATLEAFKRVALTPLCSLADDSIEFPEAWLPAGAAGSEIVKGSGAP
jgi:hypothetical protein